MVRANVLALPVGGTDVPSTRYRLLKLLPQLDSAGLNMTVVEPGDGTLGRSTSTGRVALSLRSADLVLVQKRLIPRVLVQAIAAARVPIVLDVDDAVFVDQSHPESLSRQVGRWEDLVRQARVVVVGNDYLADWARGLGAEVHVIPTGVDVDLWNPQGLRGHEGVVLGWIGTSSNLTYLEAILGPLVDALEGAPNSRLVIVSDRPLPYEHPAVEFRRWDLATELESVADFDIGLMPLLDDRWTRGKCAFKALQCMALGLPVVASPVGASAQAIDDGVAGLLAHDDAEWKRALSMLIHDQSMRKSLGAAARRAVVERHGLDRAGASLASAIGSALAPGVG